MINQTLLPNAHLFVYNMSVGTYDTFECTGTMYLLSHLTSFCTYKSHEEEKVHGEYIIIHKYYNGIQM